MKSVILIILIFFSFVSMCVYGQSHKVETGQTLYGIAQKYGVSVKMLMDVNGIRDPKTISEGISLIIPNSTELSQKIEKNIKADIQRHKVISGDTYYSIARRYRVSLHNLLNVNGRSSEALLRVGEILSLPNNLRSHKASKTFVTKDKEQNNFSSFSANQRVVNKNKLMWPVSGRIMKHIGKQGGVKIQMSTPQDVRAVASGTVVYYGRYRELGPIILVEHEGGYIYIYAGIAAAPNSLKVGDRVYYADIIGRSVPGRDIVFSVFKDAIPIDPKDAPRV